jgi:hypothetical protein
MPTKNRQLQYKSDGWKRLLEFITSENAYCKNRLADVIKSSKADEGLLEQAEYFQNYYIQQDALLSLLRNDIYAFDKLLQKEKILNGVSRELNVSKNRLKDELDKVQSEYRRAKNKFNDFLDAYM